MKWIFFILLSGCAGNLVSTFDSPVRTEIVDSFPHVRIQKGTYNYSGTKYVLKRHMSHVTVYEKKYKVSKYILFQDSIYIYEKQ